MLDAATGSAARGAGGVRGPQGAWPQGRGAEVARLPLVLQGPHRAGGSGCGVWGAGELAHAPRGGGTAAPPPHTGQTQPGTGTAEPRF